MINPLTRPTTLLRIEGLAMLAAGLVLYARLGGSWVLFAVLLLAPDLSVLGYLRGPRMGATTYNLLHLYLWPAGLGVAGLLLGNPTSVWLALIWSSHIKRRSSPRVRAKAADRLQRHASGENRRRQPLIPPERWHLRS